MPTFPLYDMQRTESIAADTANSRGTTVTASSSTNIKGSYAQLVAATAFKASGILIMISDITVAQESLMDIAIGAASSEVIIAENLAIVGMPVGSISPGMQYFLPVEIPAGTRIAARTQSTVVSANIRVVCILFGAGMAQGESLAKVDTYGAVTSGASRGTSIDPGGSAHNKGSYVQITASTNRPHKFLSIAIGNQLNSARTSCVWLIDIAIGGAGSEVVILANIPLNCSSTSDIVLPQCFNMIPVNIPAGTRIAVRAQCSDTNATDRLLDIILYFM